MEEDAGEMEVADPGIGGLRYMILRDDAWRARERREKEVAAPGTGGFPYMDDVMAACATPGLSAERDQLISLGFELDSMTPCYVCNIKSEAGLDDAIAKGKAAGLAPNARIVAMALPTMRLGSCRLLLGPAAEGKYAGFNLTFFPPTMLHEKLAAADAVDEALRLLEDALRSTTVVPSVKPPQPDPTQSVRAQVAAQCWDRDVEDVRVAAEARIVRTAERLRCLLTGLHILL